MGRRARGHTPAKHDGEIPPPPRSQQTAPSEDRLREALRPFAEHGGKCDYFPHGGCASHPTLHQKARGGGYESWDCPYDVARAALLADPQNGGAERERDALRTDNDRLRKAINALPCYVWLGRGRLCGDCEACRARAELSADAEPGQATGMCGCGHYASQHALGWKACGFCGCPQYAESSDADTGGAA